jgi:hypothetical protein
MSGCKTSIDICQYRSPTLKGLKHVNPAIVVGLPAARKTL